MRGVEGAAPYERERREQAPALRGVTTGRENRPRRGGDAKRGVEGAAPYGEMEAQNINFVQKTARFYIDNNLAKHYNESRKSIT